MDNNRQRLENEDWLKTRTWDILPPTAATLLDTLDVSRKSFLEQRRAIAKFMELPAARAMPEELRAELLSLGLLDRGPND